MAEPDWDALEVRFPEAPVARLRACFEQDLPRVTPADLDDGEEAAVLLEHFANQGWLRREKVWICTDSNEPLSIDDMAQSEQPGARCPGCDDLHANHSGVRVECLYDRDLPEQRLVNWVLALHGMNTYGAWQEALSWRVATTYGRSVPVSIFKYGKVITGVLRPFSRQKLKIQLIRQIKSASGEADEQGYGGRPDVIAHSFGTWLLGHALLDDPDLKVGRVILTGCILPPDFPWDEIRRRGQVEAVLNHYGTKDFWAGIAHHVIAMSGPAGRRGFDNTGVTNVLAGPYGHSEYFEPTKLELAYDAVWKPFLQNRTGRLTPAQPAVPWKRAWWPFRATLLPLFLLLLVVLVPVVALRGLSAIPAYSWGHVLWPAAATLGVILLLVLFAWLGRCLTRWRTGRARNN